MFCKHCGNQLPDNAKFCDSCGAPAARQEAAVPTYIAEVVDKSPVGFLDAIRLYFNNYANFSGRSRRSEYWYAQLFAVILGTVFGLILPDLSWLLTLALFVPNLSVAVRRLHDSGKSGWYYLWSLLPIAGGIIVLIRLCKDSEGDNQWGPSPKY
jgi:uncharacterized membrane protein YhaH (DUF805 family)